MSRATNAPASRARRRRILERAKGFRGPRSKNIRQAMEAVDRAMRMATVHRKLKKAEKLGYQPSVTGSVPSQDGEEQAEQVEQHLPFKDD